MTETPSLSRREIIPTILSFSPDKNDYVIGNEARILGIKGRTNAHNFKMRMGNPPGDFDKKDYWMLVGERDGRPDARMHSCRQVATLFLSAVLERCVDRYQKIMIGIPAIHSANWYQHYHAHMLDVIQNIGFPEEPAFLPEPFALFQFYRHIEKLIPESDHSQVILLVDIGGGTCNTCIIKTTAAGRLAIGSQAAKPFGSKAVDFGGKAVDIELLRMALKTDKDFPRGYKDSPIDRARSQFSPLLKVEDAKLKLCRQVVKNGGSRIDAIREIVHFDHGEIHAGKEVDLTLTSNDIFEVVKNAWTKHWMHCALDTIKTAEAEGCHVHNIDKVILCGGTGQVPFLQDFVSSSLAGRLHQGARDVVAGTSPGFSVAEGIRKECEVLSGRDPSLLANDLGRWACSPMYLGVRRNRAEDYTPVTVLGSNQVGSAQLISEWTRLDNEVIERDIELPFELPERLFFGLFDRPGPHNREAVPLNVVQDTVRVPEGRYREKAKFLLKQTPEGALQCELTLFRKKHGRGPDTQRLELPEFFSEALRIHTGKSVLGLDFGTSNTYLVELDFAEHERQVDYFSFRIKPSVKDQLTELQETIRRSKEEGLLDSELLKKYAFACRVDVVCHSIKLEGSSITRGTTLDVVEKGNPPSTPAQFEAKRLGEAYLWTLDNYNEFTRQPEVFAREVNGIALREIKHNTGSYRTEGVKVPTRTEPYVPPDGISVPALMRRWSDFVRDGAGTRSPIEFAAALHSMFVRIHPFIDGNGRTARLLVNAYLLSEGLPIVVPTIDDRERYIDSLAESDEGGGDNFTRYLIELFEESLDGIRAFKQSLTLDSTQVTEESEPEIEVSLEDDPLALVMGRVIEKDRLPAKKIYPSWKVAFEGLRVELEAQIDWFNRQYVGEGYEASIIEYDILSEDKFSRLFLGLRTTKTWFVGLEIMGPGRKEKFVFFFQHEAAGSKEFGSGSVVLRIGRHDGDTYRNLTPDVFQVSQIGWKDGSIEFSWPDDVLGKEPLRRQIRRLLAEIIKAFLL